MEVNKNIREYMLMGCSFDEAKELCTREIIFREQLKKQKTNIKNPSIRINKVTNKKGFAITCTDHLGNVFFSISDMTKHYGITVNAYQHRLRGGWSKERALTTPLMSVLSVCTDHLGNRYKCREEMLKHYGISLCAYKNRIKKGWSIEKALTEPLEYKKTKKNEH